MNNILTEAKHKDCTKNVTRHSQFQREYHKPKSHISKSEA
jgi:hypothetical protein